MLNPIRRHLQWSSFFRAGHRHRSQNDDQRIHRTEVVRFGMREVIGEWKKEQDDGEAYTPREITLEDAPQADQAEDRHGCVDKNVGWIERLVLQILAREAPVARPHVDGAATGHPYKPRGMAVDVGSALL